jgi:hypothetical protein
MLWLPHGSGGSPGGPLASPTLSSHGDSFSDAGTSDSGSIASSSTSEIPLPPGWLMQTTADGKPYFVNKEKVTPPAVPTRSRVHAHLHHRNDNNNITRF